MDFFKLSICTASGAETPRLLIAQMSSRPGMLGGQTDASDEAAMSGIMYTNPCYAFGLFLSMRCLMSHGSLAREPNFRIKPGSFPRSINFLEDADGTSKGWSRDSPDTSCAFRGYVCACQGLRIACLQR